MAESAETQSTVRIHVEPASTDDSSEKDEVCAKETKKAVPPDGQIDKYSCTISDKPRERVLRPSLFLRPSALSGDVIKTNSSSSVQTNSSSATNNKFATPDSSTDAMFDIAPKSDKNDIKPAMMTPVNIPAPSPLSNPDYVFGQNMLARVTERKDAVSNGNGSMLFSAALSAENGSAKEDGDKEVSSLLEDAARCQEQRTAKRKYEEVLVSTGEENELNILQITVKLFAFEGGSWVERGRGTLRLNDTAGATPSSRIVVRTLGSLRVVLNTKIWSGMEFARANERSIRTTALDASGQLKIFLIQGSPSDVSSLHTCMEIRLRKCREENSLNSEKEDSEEPSASEKEEDKTEDGSLRPPKAAALESTS